MLHPSCTLRNDLVLSSDENAAIVSFEISLYSAALIGFSMVMFPAADMAPPETFRRSSIVSGTTRDFSLAPNTSDTPSMASRSFRRSSA